MPRLKGGEKIGYCASTRGAAGTNLMLLNAKATPIAIYTYIYVREAVGLVVYFLINNNKATIIMLGAALVVCSIHYFPKFSQTKTAYPDLDFSYVFRSVSI